MSMKRDADFYQLALIITFTLMVVGIALLLNPA